MTEASSFHSRQRYEIITSLFDLYPRSGLPSVRRPRTDTVIIERPPFVSPTSLDLPPVSSLSPTRGPRLLYSLPLSREAHT